MELDEYTPDTESNYNRLTIVFIAVILLMAYAFRSEYYKSVNRDQVLVEARMID
jgi:hypothetical protein